MKKKVWSDIHQKEYEILDLYSLATWFPPIDLVIVTTIIAIALTYMRILVQNRVFEYAEKEKIKEKRKFSESTWKAIFYFISWCWGMYEVLNCDWFPETSNCWNSFPEIPPMETSLKMYYIFQFGFYWHSLYAHLTMEITRSDFWPLLFHHVVTILLIYVSYQLGFYRIGLLVVVAHDTNDVIFEIGKIFVYREMKIMMNACFILIMISWVITRLGIFPFIIIRSTLFESIEYVPWDLAPHMFYYEFNFGLIFLLCLHIYWFWLMIQILIRSLKGTPVTDVRETEEK